MTRTRASDSTMSVHRAPLVPRGIFTNGPGADGPVEYEDPIAEHAQQLLYGFRRGSRRRVVWRADPGCMARHSPSHTQLSARLRAWLPASGAGRPRPLRRTVVDMDA